MIGICTDNASNMRAAGRLVEGTVWLGCMAHSAELLSRDLWGLFPGVSDRVTTLETFFRTHAYPRSCYAEEMARHVGATFLVQACATRWGTKAKTLESCIRNSVVVENTLSRLRREKYSEETFNTLAWVWVPLVWAQQFPF